MKKSDKKGFIPRSLKEQQIIEKWKIIEFLGYGKSMEAYLARQTFSSSEKAFLIVREGLDEESKERTSKKIQQSIKNMSNLSHTNISEVFDAGNFEGRTWYVREYSKKTLKDILEEEKKMNFFKATNLMLDYLNGLEAIHQKGFIHSDIKPGNLMVSNRGFITDLEFTKPEKDDSELKISLSKTKEKQTITFSTEYGSPEQLGEITSEIDLRSDLYSLMKIYYRMLAGKFSEVGEKLTEIRKDLPKDLEKIISRGLRRNPEERYQTAGEIIQDLNKFVENYPPSQLIKSKLYSMLKLPVKHKIKTGLISTLLLIASNNFLCNKIETKKEPLEEITKTIPTHEIKPIELNPPNSGENKSELDYSPSNNTLIQPEESDNKTEEIPKKEINIPEQVNESPITEPIKEKEIKTPKYTPQKIPEYTPPIKEQEIEKPIENIPKLEEKVQEIKTQENKPSSEPKKQEYENQSEGKYLPIFPKIEESKLEREIKDPSPYFRITLAYSQLGQIEKDIEINDLKGANLRGDILLGKNFGLSFGTSYTESSEHEESPGGFLNSSYSQTDYSILLTYDLVNTEWIRFYAGAGGGQSISKVKITGLIGTTEVRETDNITIPYWTIEAGASIPLTDDISIRTWLSYIDYSEIKNQNTETSLEGGIGIEFNWGK